MYDNNHYYKVLLSCLTNYRICVSYIIEISNKNSFALYMSLR